VPKSSAAASTRAQRIVAACLAFGLVFAAPTAALSQVLYKWMDNDGKVQYSDRLPKGFTGPVTRIDADLDPTPRPAPAPWQRPDAAATDAVKPQPAVDIAKKRRELRVKLEAQLVAARERVAAAKAALDGGENPQDDERQVVQQRFDRAQAGRSNCRLAPGPGGKTVAVCPAVVPSEGYYDRIKQLEDAVRQAEAGLSAAEDAYRRGVD
jgi:hypothetical protein